MELVNKTEHERPTLAVEDRIIEAKHLGQKVIAKIRGFRVALSPIAFFYIELIAIDNQNNQEVEIGFWPGMTQQLAVAEETLMKIKTKHKNVTILHLRDPVYST